MTVSEGKCYASAEELIADLGENTMSDPCKCKEFILRRDGVRECKKCTHLECCHYRRDFVAGLPKPCHYGERL
jgi:hypothetical protein